MNSGEKLAVIGAGAIGSLVGGMLARAGENVTLVGRKKHIQAIEQNGLNIDGVAGTFNVRIKTAEKLDFKPDIVFVAAKSQDVEEICMEIKPFVGNIPIVMMQNGVRAADMAASILGEENIISCILLLNAQFIRDGAVTYVNRSSIVIGMVFDENGRRMERIQSLLNNVSDTIISENIRGAQWTKLFINAMSNSIDAMTGLTLGEYVKHYRVRKIAVLILKEALQIVEKADIKLEELPGIPISFFKMIIRMPTPIASLILRFALSSKGSSDIITSTLQSIRKGKKTEIDYINGEFVKLGKEMSIPTPHNSKVIELIHKIEESQVFYSPNELSRLFDC